jgi:hypothetical protein
MGDLMKWLALVSILLLAGCGASRELRNASTGTEATCSAQVLGDPVVPLPDNSAYCTCMRDHLAQGFVAVGAPPMLHMCRSLPD